MLPGGGLKIKLLMLLAAAFLLVSCAIENAEQNADERLGEPTAADLPLEEATTLPAEEAILPPAGEITMPLAQEKAIPSAEEKVILDSEAKVVEQLNKMLAE